MPYTTWPCEITGSPANPPLVLLHGFLGAGADWRAVTERLQERYWCIAPDLPGHGRNRPALPERPLTLRGLAGELRRSLQALGAGPAHVLGYSLGGRLALHLALACPGQVRALLLESASPGLENRQARAERRALDDRRAAELRAQGMAAFLETWYAMPLFATLRRHPAALQSLVHGRETNDPAWMARILADLSPGRQPALWKRLPGLRLPVLWLAGELDPAYAANLGRAAGLLPEVRTALAPESGHNLHVEAPEWFYRQVSGFLAQVDAESTGL